MCIENMGTMSSACLCTCPERGSSIVRQSYLVVERTLQSFDLWLVPIYSTLSGTKLAFSGPGSLGLLLIFLDM